MRIDLTNESIEKACNSIEEFFTKEGIERIEITKTRLMAEEALLLYQDEYGTNVEAEINFAKKFNKCSVQLNVFCKKMDPFAKDDDGIMKSLKGTMTDSIHAWKYVRGNYSWIFSGEDRNEIVLSVVKKSRLNGFVKVLILIAIAIIAALILKNTLSAETISILSNDYVRPIANAYTGLLGVGAVLLIFFSIPLCMVQYGSAVTFQNDARNLIVGFIKVLTVCIALVTIVGAISFGITADSKGMGMFLKPILDVLLDFIPTNLLQPFLSFNCMQVMIIGALFGTAFLVMGEQAKSITSAFDKVNYAAIIINNNLIKFVPIYTAVMVFDMILVNGGMPKALLWAVIVTAISCLLGIICMGVIVSVKYKVNLLVFYRKLLPSFLISLFTGSAGVAFAKLFEELSEECGVEMNYANVSVNLGTVLFKPMYSVFLAAVGFLFASYVDNLTIVVAIQIILMSFILPSAIPNVQGGAASVIVVLLGGFGVTEEATQIAVTINSLLQFIIIPVNLFMLQCVIILEAGKNGKLDVTKLISKKSLH